MKRAQSTFEYAVLIIIFAAAFIGMHTYARKAVQAHLRLVQDQITSPNVVMH